MATPWKPEQILVPSVLRRWRRPAVYAWRRGRRWLYVGSSTQVLLRVVHHNIIGRVRWFTARDRIEIQYVGSVAQAETLERALVREHEPRFNVEAQVARARKRAVMQRRRRCAWPSCGELFRPGRVDQKYHTEHCRNAHWREQHPRQKLSAEPVA